MDKKFISNPRKGEKLLLKNRTYKHIFKKDQSPKKGSNLYKRDKFSELISQNNQGCKNKKTQEIRQMVEIITRDVKARC